MNFQMWGKALRGIPRIDKEEWNALDIISRWLIATRAAVLIMTLISASIAGIMAIRAGEFHFGRWILLTIGLIFAHATNNILNDLTDYKRGVDQDNYFRAQYGPQAVQQGLLSQREMLAYAAVSGLIAIAAGIPLVIQGGLTALLLLLAGAFFVLFYTWPLKYFGLGEIAVIVVWGPLMIGGGYYAITGLWDWNVVIASLPYALGTTMVIFGKHIDKIQQDKSKRIHTLPVLLGEKTSRLFTLAMMALQYLLVIYLVVIGFFSPILLGVLLALHTVPRVLQVYRNPKPERRPADYPADVWPLWFVASAFYHNRAFGLYYLVALVLDTILF